MKLSGAYLVISNRTQLVMLVIPNHDELVQLGITNRDKLGMVRHVQRIQLGMLDITIGCSAPVDQTLKRAPNSVFITLYSRTNR